MSISAAAPAGGGRRATSISVSLMPGERADLDEFVARTGIGPSALHHRLLAPKLRSAVWLLRELDEAGVALDPGELPETIWDAGTTADELADLYSGAKDVGYPE